MSSNKPLCTLFVTFCDYEDTKREITTAHVFNTKDQLLYPQTRRVFHRIGSKRHTYEYNKMLSPIRLIDDTTSSSDEYGSSTQGFGGRSTNYSNLKALKSAQIQRPTSYSSKKLLVQEIALSYSAPLSIYPPSLSPASPTYDTITALTPVTNLSQTDIRDTNENYRETSIPIRQRAYTYSKHSPVKDELRSAKRAATRQETEFPVTITSPIFDSEPIPYYSLPVIKRRRSHSQSALSSRTNETLISESRRVEEFHEIRSSGHRPRSEEMPSVGVIAQQYESDTRERWAQSTPPTLERRRTPTPKMKSPKISPTPQPNYRRVIIETNGNGSSRYSKVPVMQPLGVTTTTIVDIDPGYGQVSRTPPTYIREECIIEEEMIERKYFLAKGKRYANKGDSVIRVSTPSKSDHKVEVAKFHEDVEEVRRASIPVRVAVEEYEAKVTEIASPIRSPTPPKSERASPKLESPKPRQPPTANTVTHQLKSAEIRTTESGHGQQSRADQSSMIRSYEEQERIIMKTNGTKTTLRDIVMSEPPPITAPTLPKEDDKKTHKFERDIRVETIEEVTSTEQRRKRLQQQQKDEEDERQRRQEEVRKVAEEREERRRREELERHAKMVEEERLRKDAEEREDKRRQDELKRKQQLEEEEEARLKEIKKRDAEKRRMEEERIEEERQLEKRRLEIARQKLETERRQKEEEEAKRAHEEKQRVEEEYRRLQIEEIIKIQEERRIIEIEQKRVEEEHVRKAQEELEEKRRLEEKVRMEEERHKREAEVREMIRKEQEERKKREREEKEAARVAEEERREKWRLDQLEVIRKIEEEHRITEERRKLEDEKAKKERKERREQSQPPAIETTEATMSSYRESNSHQRYESSSRIGEGVTSRSYEYTSAVARPAVTTVYEKTSANRGYVAGSGLSSYGAHCTIALRSAREKEKGELIYLNDQLADYIEKVRFLEAQNRILSADLELLRRGFSGTGIESMCHSELETAKRVITDTHTARKAFESDIGRLGGEVDTWRAKWLEILKTRKGIRGDLDADLDKLAGIEAEIALVKRRIRIVEEECIGVRQHNTRIGADISRVKSQRDHELIVAREHQARVQDFLVRVQHFAEEQKYSISREIEFIRRDTTAENRDYFRRELQAAMRDIRANYESIVHRNRVEIESWYHSQVRRIEGGIGHAGRGHEAYRVEITRIRTELTAMRSRMAELESRNAHLQSTIQDLAYQSELDHQMFEASLAERDRAIQHMRDQCTELTAQMESLCDVQITLEKEIARYRSLIQGANVRTYDAYSISSRTHYAAPATTTSYRAYESSSTAHRSGGGGYSAYSATASGGGGLAGGHYVSTLSGGGAAIGSGVASGGSALRETSRYESSSYRASSGLH